ncbi:histidine phosphatase family protein [Baekduia soli]|uniref:Histidine phosphatase family protein n=1 Tax=Baekduia soli TaxID=496014 RepID=A0A5B8U282_9ACTN|nr:histidine phosphatase family protein [Baekduia soli]QEC47022.1 histidine phosphatase family protein [Baekduia soli]
MRRLVVVRHAPTEATRAFAFPADEPLDDRGRSAASALAASLPSGYDILSSPARRCLETIECAGLAAPTVDPALAECDFGSWAGQSLDTLTATDPDAVRAWMTDPGAAPHGGESLVEFAERIARWLDDQAQRDGSAVVITHGGVAKAAVVHALGAPLEAFWRIDVAPLAVTELHAHDGRWTLTRTNTTSPTAAAA